MLISNVQKIKMNVNQLNIVNGFMDSHNNVSIHLNVEIFLLMNAKTIRCVIFLKDNADKKMNDQKQSSQKKNEYYKDIIITSLNTNLFIMRCILYSINIHKCFILDFLI